VVAEVERSAALGALAGGGVEAGCSIRWKTHAARIAPAAKLVAETAIMALNALGERRQRRKM
jgi:hypothetical protein